MASAAGRAECLVHQCVAAGVETGIVAGAAGGAECLVHQYVAAGVETGIVAGAAGGAECLVHQYVAAGVETGIVAGAAGGAELVKPVAEGNVFTCTLLYFPFFVLFFPLSFLFCFFPSPFGGERRGDGKGVEVYMAVFYMGGGGGGGQR